MEDILRFRTRDTRTPFYQVLGSTFYRNRRNGYEMPGEPQSVYFGPGVMEKCFDINHGAQTIYNVGGPLFILRVTEPTGVCGEGFIFPVSTASEPPGYPVKRYSDDFWQAGYSGRFIHTGLPDLVQISNKDITSPTDYRSQINPNDLSDLGSRAYSRLRPKIEVAGLGQSIAEARDVPATLKTSAKGFSDIWRSLGGDGIRTLMSPKKVAEHFVNHQFGWRPFVKDVGDMYKLISDYESYLDRAERSNDKWLNRRFAEEETLDETVLINQTRQKGDVLFRTYLNPSVLGSATSVTLTVKRQKMTRIWYEGSFKYYSPEFDNRVPMQENLRRGRQFLSLAGANINPTLLWKVTPWSWCADWFVNVGDNIQLAQDIATDSVASKYMYLMRETFDRYEYTTVHNGPTYNIVGTSYQEVRVKRRVAAESPFGFSMPPSGLSGMQEAILAAIGYSRLAK